MVAAFSGAVMVAVLLVPAGSAAFASSLFASGTVLVDANGNGGVEPTGSAGEVDAPLAGVTVTLKGSDPQHPGWTTTTAADGTWSFPADADYSASPEPYTVTIDVAGVGGDVYATETSTTASNDFARVNGQPQQATSAPFAGGDAPVLNGLVYPVWKLELALAAAADGYQGKAVHTGTAPFDTGDGAGQDSSASNDRVRSSDVMSFDWSMTAASDFALGDQFATAVFEQTIDLDEGAVANFASVPVVCESGVITAYPSGAVIQPRTDPPAGTRSVVLTCPRGTMGKDRQALLQSTSIWVSASSVAGTSFTTSGRAYATNEAGSAVARPSDASTNGPFEIVSAPRYDVRKDFLYQNNTTATFNGVPNTPVAQFFYGVAISTDRRFGSEALAQPITIDEDFWAQYTAGQNGPDGSVVPDLAYEINACTPVSQTNALGNSMPVYGVAGGTATDANTVVNSGKCTLTRDQPGDPTSGYSLTLNGIDFSGSRYPTKTVAGGDLSNGPYYVASYYVRVIVPLSELDRAVGAPDDGAGALSFYNRVGGFDPQGVSGMSNYGDGAEPGYCPQGSSADAASGCTLMEDKTRSNNVTGPKGVALSQGTWSKYFADHTTPWSVSNAVVLPQASSVHDGAGLVQPGEVHNSLIQFNNSNPITAIANPQACDVFDNSMARLAPLNKTGGRPSMASLPDDLYSYVLVTGASVAANQEYTKNFVIEYAHVDLSGDDPNSGVFDATSNRWEGDWTRQRSIGCEGVPADAWRTDPNAVPGGIDEVNVVRLRAIDGFGVAPSTNANWFLAFEQRETFYGGPHDGMQIPSGTVVANFGRVRADNMSPNWSAVNYIPGAGMTAGKHQSAESTHTDGDRWTVTRATATLKKRTIAADVGGVQAGGVADVDTTGVTIAGQPVVWELRPTLSAVSSTPAPVAHVRVTDTLPKYVTYDEAATAALTGGTPASSYTVNANGTTTLVWELGTLTPNQPIAPLRVVTHTDALAPNGTTVVNTATLTADGVMQLKAMTDDHTVRLEQTGELQLKKSVDSALDLRDDTQTYTLQVKSFSDTLAIAAPTVYEVLPYVGDQRNAVGVNREPSSRYTGTNTLTAPPQAFEFDGTTALAGTFYYTTVAPGSVPQSVDVDTDPSIWSTTFTARATAFKFVAANPLAVTSAGSKSGLVISFTTAQGGNDAGNLYANRFTAFSDTLMSGTKHQLLTSNQTTVRVLGFSLGDLIWTEKDYDGKYTPGVDTPAPKGVKVEVYDAASDALVATATTNDQGRWVVNDLNPGDYYAVIPASQLAVGAPLAGRFVYTGADADPNSDANEDQRHDGVSDGAGGIKTAPIHLSATVNRPVITGDEPTLDNPGDLRFTPLTTDPFTNLTLDIALYAAHSLQIQKVGVAVDNTEVPMAGSSWVIRSDNSARPGPVLTTAPVTAVDGQTGRFTVSGLPAGTYWLEETVAPEGFALLADPVAFTVAVDGTIALVDAQAQAGVVDVTTSDGTWLLTVHDVSAVRLPTAGGAGQDRWVVAGGAALALALLVALAFRRREYAAARPAHARPRGV